jgi:hypothetical protein
MIANLLLLAQSEVEQPSDVWTLRNLILLVGIVVIIVGYKIYKNKTMS